MDIKRKEKKRKFALANQIDIPLFSIAQFGCLSIHYKINTIDRDMYLPVVSSLLTCRRSNLQSRPKTKTSRIILGTLMRFILTGYIFQNKIKKKKKMVD